MRIPLYAIDRDFETNIYISEPQSFRLGVTGQPFPPHEGMHDRVSTIEIYKDVNERRRMYFLGKEGRIFSGWGMCSSFVICVMIWQLITNVENH